MGDDDHGGEWFFHSKAPHFLEIISPRQLRSPNLRVPENFARNHGGALSSGWVFLKVPSGSTWKVKLHRDEQGFVLRDGWEAFMKHHNICEGYFVYFKCDEGWTFQVVIFDETAREIKYRIGPGRCPDKADEPLPGVVKEEPVEERQPSVDGRKRKADPRLRNAKAKSQRRGKPLVRGSGVSGPRASGRLFQDSAKAPDGMNAAGDAEGHMNSHCKNFSPGVKVAERSGALSRATSFKCKGPSLLVIVQPTVVHPTFLLRLPRTFSSMFASKIGESGEMSLMVSGNRIWKVGYVNEKCCRTSQGWRKFAEENDLKVGDVCVFELLTGLSGVVFFVTIFRSKGTLSTP